MSRLGLRALLLATCEAWDQVEGPSLGAAVLAIVRERPRLRAIISDMREGIESLKARLATAEEYSTTLDTARREDREILTANNVALTASKKQEQILKDCLADIRLQRDRAEQEVERLATDLAQAGAAADSLLTGLEDCRHALANMTSERDAAQESERTLRAAHFGERLDKASATVAQWPEWKRNILGRTAGTTSKPRPQPGDAVPWADVEDGALYFDSPCEVPFIGCYGGRWHWAAPDGNGLWSLLRGHGADRPGPTTAQADKATLVARNLGSDPEAWRAAMRTWAANGNRPSVDPVATPPTPTTGEDAKPRRRTCPHREDGDTSACDHCCLFG